jgi:hypothetical protein
MSSSSSSSSLISVTMLPNCAEDRCSISHPCTHGQGDCDSNYECVNSTCVINIGHLYGCPSLVDICVGS